MRTARFLAAALVVAACSRNPEPGGEATGAANTTARDTTMMAADSGKMGEMGMHGDTAQAVGDSALVHQEGPTQPGQETMKSDTVVGDSTLTGQANDTRAPGDTSMMHGDSAMTGPEDAVPTDSAQGGRP